MAGVSRIIVGVDDTTENVVTGVNIQSKSFHVPGEPELVKLNVKGSWRKSYCEMRKKSPDARLLIFASNEHSLHD